MCDCDGERSSDVYKLINLWQFRKLFPPTKWAAEFNAALTVPFFHWLVGPSEVSIISLHPGVIYHCCYIMLARRRIRMTGISYIEIRRRKETKQNSFILLISSHTTVHTRNPNNLVVSFLKLPSFAGLINFWSNLSF